MAEKQAASTRETTAAKRLRMAAFWLRRAADEFSNHGCNDLDEETIAAFRLTDEEKETFAADYSKWNGDPENLRTIGCLGDDSMMDFLADELEQVAAALAKAGM
jgi:hypothetical protein